jgi:hypothetical protein
MIDPNFCFVTGVPGSSWSMISHRLKILLNHDLSDIDGTREHLAAHRDPTQGKCNRTHHGSYFGPCNEFGEHFDDIPNNYTLESFYNECNLPFINGNNRQTRCIRSHWFSYNLNWLWENCKGNTILLIHKESKGAINWWKKIGGWNIKHPIYTWYENDEKMAEQILEENNNLLRFAKEKNLEWETYCEEWWLEKFGKEETTQAGRPSHLEYDVNKISVIYTKII